jgi:hypothetical protein
MAALPDGSVLRHTQNNLKTGLYYAVLAQGDQTVTPERIRFVEARLFACPSCGQQGYEEKTVVHKPNCPRDPLFQKPDGRMVLCSRTEWALRPFYKTTDPERLYQLTDDQVLDHRWFAKLVHLSAPKWNSFSPEERETWCARLPANNVLFCLLPSHYLDICRFARTAGERMIFLRNMALQRRAYAQLLTEVESGPDAPPANANAQWWHYVMERGCAISPWYYLLLCGLPPHLEESAPALSRFEQLILICREGDRARFRENTAVFRPKAPKHLWAKD